MKKVFISLLSLLMCMAIIMPISADDDLACDAESAVACVDGVGYTTLADAVKGAAEGATVQLVKDVDLAGVGLTVGKTLTLDLNGKNLEVDNGLGKLVINGGTFILKDSVGSGRIFSESVYGGSNTTALVYVTGEDTNFVMESGYIYSVIADDPANKGQFGVGVMDGANVTINGGKIEAGWYAISGNGNDVDTHSEVVINGGELISVADYAIYHPHNGTLTINGGVVYGAAGGIAMNRGELVVNGGTITSKGKGSTGDWGDGTGGLNNSAVNVEAKYGEVNAELNGGEFIAEENAVTIAENASNPSTVVVTGGTYTDSVNEYADDSVVGVEAPEGYVYGPDASEYINNHIGETITVVNGISVNAPEGSKIENQTGSNITVNGKPVKAGEEYSVPVSEKLPVCAGSKDKNCDGVVTCDEEKGEGWTWNNKLKVCEYTGKTSYTVVNTAAK